MLDVRLAVGAGRSEEDALLASDELGQIGRDAHLPRPAFLHARISLSRPFTALDCLDGRRESDIAGIRVRQRLFHCSATLRPIKSRRFILIDTATSSSMK